VQWNSGEKAECGRKKAEKRHSAFNITYPDTLFHMISHIDMHGATNEKFSQKFRDISSRAQAYLYRWQEKTSKEFPAATPSGVKTSRDFSRRKQKNPKGGATPIIPVVQSS